MVKSNSLPYCAWSFFTKKFFLGFLFGLTKETPKQYSALKQEDVLVRDNLPVVIRCLTLRRKEDRKLKTVAKNISSTKKK